MFPACTCRNLIQPTTTCQPTKQQRHALHSSSYQSKATSFAKRITGTFDGTWPCGKFAQNHLTLIVGVSQYLTRHDYSLTRTQDPAAPEYHERRCTSIVSWHSKQQNKMGVQPASDDPRPRVVIVGAGVGGVATAARLAAAGCKVTVVEKNDFTGGRCSLIHRQNYVPDLLR
jgi:threonine dehydrogenase-like Zn-dependent dehydrogenase